jgi:hypothetical protein
MIRTPGGNVFTNQLAVSTPLNLAGKIYKTHLIVLDGQGIDVILGMSWMRDNKALLGIATRVVHLDSPIHGVTALQLPLTSVLTPSVHHTTTHNLEDIPVAYEFPDASLYDWPGRLPDRDVEFNIELQLVLHLSPYGHTR